MNITKEKVTPKRAMQWLKRNIANRPISSHTVADYAKAIVDGAWKLNGDTIRFNGNGDLIDGQHRLHACVKAGESFETYIIHGLEHEAFDTIDQGKKRTTSDVFARDGYKSYTTLATAVKWVARYHKGICNGSPRFRPDEAHDVLEKNPNLHHATDLALRLIRQQRIMSAGLLAFLIHETSLLDEQRSEEFWTSAITGESLLKGSPAHILHKRLVSNHGSVAKLHGIAIAALSIKAWNFHYAKKTCGTLKWSEAEAFPLIAEK